MRTSFRAGVVANAAKRLAQVFYPNNRSLEDTQMHSVSEQDFLKRLFAKFSIDCVFDVGANVGQYAQSLRNIVGYRDHIVSFEAIPQCAEELRRASRQDDKWHVEEVVVSEEKGSSAFNIMECTEFSSLHSPRLNDFDLTQDGNQVVSVLNAKTDTLAHFIEKYREALGFSRPFLKMDTQGHDLHVARSAGGFLDEFVGLQSELSIVPIYDDIPNMMEALEFYNQRNFVLSALVPNNAGHFPYLIETDCIMLNRKYIDKHDAYSKMGRHS